MRLLFATNPRRVIALDEKQNKIVILDDDGRHVDDTIGDPTSWIDSNYKSGRMYPIRDSDGSFGINGNSIPDIVLSEDENGFFWKRLKDLR